MKYLQEIIQSLLQSRGISVLPKNSITDKETDYGNYSTAVAFTLAKEQGQSPQKVAEELQRELAEQLQGMVDVSVSEGAPFINFTLTPQGWANYVARALEEDLDWGASENNKGRKFLIEFISANPTGPLTLANARGGYSGDALARIYEFTGAKVEREYYYNDSGNQILELGKSIVAAREGTTFEGGYKGPYIEELAKIILVTDPYEAGQLAGEYILNTWIKPMITRMGIDFDAYKSEQSLIDEGNVEDVRNILDKHHLLYQAEGALWLKTKDAFGEDKDRVMQRSDGTYTYLMKDFAYHWEKIQRGYSDLISIFGADHFTESKTLYSVVDRVLRQEADWNGRLSFPIIQFVRLLEDGKEVKMSKRAGTYVTIDDLLDRINPDVARFFFLMRSLDTHLDFDLTLAESESDKNPVYYVQYAFVRAKHILEKNEDDITVPSSLNLNEYEIRLAKQLLHFPTLVLDAAETQEAHLLTHYAIELARHFHAFYTQNPVLQAEDSLRQQRLALTKLTYQTLAQVLSLIGVSQPERMTQ